jgi:hypothetical protein
MCNSLFKAAKAGTYQRVTYPHLVKVIPLKNSLQDLDLLAKSIAYTLVTPYNQRVDFHWRLLSRFICNTEENYISLVFKSPNNLKDLKVTYIHNLDDLKLFPSLRDKVLSNLLQIIRDE